MDGYTLAQCLRTKKAIAPIITITAHAAAEERARCERAGIDTVLVAILRRITMNLLRQDRTSKAGLKNRRMLVCASDRYLAHLLGW
jgi:two-component system capsular synthesis sensor histidine kinase RcsC